MDDKNKTKTKEDAPDAKVSSTPAVKLVFKDGWKKASKIQIRVEKLNRFYPITRERLVELAVEDKLDKAKVKTFFTPESILAQFGKNY